MIKEVVFLVVMTLSSTGGSPTFYYHEIPTMQQCYEIIEHAKIRIPDAGDAEAYVVMYCAPTKVHWWQKLRKGDTP